MEIQWWNNTAVDWSNSYEKELQAISGVTIVKKLWDVRVGPKPYFDVFKDWLMVIEYRKYYLILTAYRRPVAGYTQWIFPGERSIMQRKMSKKYAGCVTLRTNKSRLLQDLRGLYIAGFKEYPQEGVSVFQERVMAKHSIDIPATSQCGFDYRMHNAAQVKTKLQRAEVLFKDPTLDGMRSQSMKGWQSETEEPLFDAELQPTQPTW